MKTPTRLALYGSLALLLAAIPAATLAAHGPGFGPGRGPGFDHGPGGRFGDGFIAGRIAERLGLSTDQLDQIRTIRAGYHDEAAPLTTMLRDARLALSDQIHGDLFDEAAIRGAASRVAAAEADLAVLRARIASDVRQVLTPEQAEQARAMRERMREFAGERGGHRRWGPGGFQAPPADGE